MFIREIEPTYSIGFNKNVWELLVSQYLNANRSGFKHGTWQSPFIAIRKKINPYCSVMFKKHRVMLPKSRKSRRSVLQTQHLHIEKNTRKFNGRITVSLQFEGTIIRHKVGETQARLIQGIARQKYKVSVLNSLLKEYCQRINYIPGEIFPAGNRDNAGTSRDVWKQIRYEKKFNINRVQLNLIVY